MKLEIWTDKGYDLRPGIWELCKKRGITKYFNGPLKVVLKDKPEKNDNLKVYFASRALMDDWKEHDKDIVEGINKQEVVSIPKILKKKGFFEKLFHLFK